jgi:septal ring factor EnvC (AmiA/AmiB activator)
MYDEIIAKAKVQYESKTGNKQQALKSLLGVVSQLQKEIEVLKAPAKKAPAKKAPAKKAPAKKAPAKKSSAKKNG